MAAIDTSSDAYERRQRRLQLLIWATTLIPMVVFALLTWQSWQMQKQSASLNSEIETKQSTLDALNAQLGTARAAVAKAEQEAEAQRASAKHYRDFAGIKVRFYRNSDRAVVEKALTGLGFNIDSELGTSQLINREPNSIGFGSLVSDEDLRDIAVALVDAGFPLKRIAPAQRQPDPKLVQIYASVESDRSCGLLKVAEVRAGKRCGDLADGVDRR